MTNRFLFNSWQPRITKDVPKYTSRIRVPNALRMYALWEAICSRIVEYPKINAIARQWNLLWGISMWSAYVLIEQVLLPKWVRDERTTSSWQRHLENSCPIDRHHHHYIQQNSHLYKFKAVSPMSIAASHEGRKSRRKSWLRQCQKTPYA